MASKRTAPQPGRVISPYDKVVDPELLRRGTIIEQLQSTLGDEETFRLFPLWLADVLEQQLWRKFSNTVTGETYEHADFDAFVRAPRPRGLGIQGGIWYLHDECRFYAEKNDESAAKALRELDRIVPKVRPESGRPPMVNDGPPANEYASIGSIFDCGRATENRSAGNRRRYALARLKRYAPALAERVMAGEMSANAAAIEAGIRQRMVQVQPTPDGFARAAERHLTPDKRLELANRLTTSEKETA